MILFDEISKTLRMFEALISNKNLKAIHFKDEKREILVYGPVAIADGRTRKCPARESGTAISWE
jgi:hypothetical protein